MTFQTTRRVAIMFAFLFSLFLTMGLLTALPTQGQGGESGTSRDLQPLPGDCTGTSPGDQTPVCCAFGYVLVDGEPIGGVEVEISSAEGSIVASTSESEDILYYGASLSDTLRVYPGDWVTFTVSYDGFTVVRTHQAVAGSQQIDLVINHLDGGGQLEQVDVASDTIKLGYGPTEDVKISDERTAKRLRPSLVTDSSGKVYVTWEDNHALANQLTHVDRIYSSYSLDRGQSWSESLPVFDDSRKLEQEAPHLVIGHDGTLYVVWTEKDQSPEINQLRSYFAKSTNGGQSWSNPVKIEDTYLNLAVNPTVALDGDGTLYAAWGDGRNVKADIYFAKSTNGGQDWDDSLKVNSDSDSVSGSSFVDFTPSLVVGGDGMLYLAWADNRSDDNFDIYFARSDDQGESWSPNPNIRINHESLNDQFTPKLAIGQDETLYAVWSDEREGANHNKIYLAKSTDKGDTWSEDLLYEPFVGATQHDPQIVIDDQGQIYVAWRQKQDNQADLLLARFSHERQTWDLIGQINDVDQTLPASEGFSPPSLALDQSGEHTLYFAWPVEYRKHDVDIHVAAWPDKNRFYSHGTYTSEVYDAQEVVAWLKYDAPTTLSSDMTITLEVRTGNMPVPDAEWSEWQRFTALPADLTLLPEGQYLQWRTTLSSTDPTSSPILGPPTLSLQSTTTETILLNGGWNLISIPGESSSHQISDVLDSIEGNYEVAQAYNACDAGESWQKYDPDSPPFANNLAEVDHTQGLWLNMTASDKLMMESVVPLTTTIRLCTGWNLVGYPSQRARSVDEALESIGDAYTIVYGYDASRGAWKTYDPAAPPFANSLEVMKPEYGYWIHVNQEADWLISNEATNDDES